jgi:hypothetical protein
MARRDHFKSSFGAFTSQQRELERARANRDERDAADAALETATHLTDVGDATESSDDATATTGGQSQDNTATA